MSDERTPDGRVPGAGLAAALALAGAVALFVLGGARENLRPEPPGSLPRDVGIPQGLEPAGELPEPPALFRWTPGGDDVDLSQVTVYRGSLERIWSSEPIRTGGELPVDPAVVFRGIPAGEPCFWRVREVTDGRPRAGSALVEFGFLVDVDGLPVGVSRPGAALLRD